MKTKIAILIILFFSFKSITAQTTIVSENIGTPGGTTTIAAHTFQNNGSLSYSSGAQTNPADVRITSASSSYSGASGGGNVYFTSTSGTFGFSIEGINASQYHTMYLQFGYKKETAASHATFSVEYWNGASWNILANTPSSLFHEATNASAVWYLSKGLALPTDAQISGLKMRFVKTGTTAIRIDDIKLTGIETLPSVTNSFVSSITNNSAIFGGDVTATNGATLSATGTVYSITAINASPILGGSGVTTLSTPSPNSGTGTFSNSSGAVFSPNVQYSYNAYATKSNTGSSGYGTVVTFYTLAVTPSVPTVDSPSATSLHITIGSDGNSSVTTYAIFETSSGNYVQANGTLGTTPIYQTAAIWGTKTVTGLSNTTTYTFQVIAKNGAGILTSASTSASGTTLTPSSITTSGTLSALNTIYGTASSSTSFTVSGSNLTDDIIISAPAGFEISSTVGGASGYANTQTLNPISGTVSSTTIYVRLAATTLFGTYSGNITVSSNNDGLNEYVATASSIVSKLVVTMGGITILNKQYDGNSTASISGIPTISGILVSDENAITLNGGSVTASFADSLIGNAKPVTVSGYSLTGAASGNYELTQPSGLTANITPSASSDLILNSTSTTNESSNIDYKIYQGTQLSNTGSGSNGSLGVMGFYLRDGGEDPDADNLPTELTSISFQVINPQLIRAARLFVGTSPRGEAVIVNGQSTIDFTNLANIIAADDDKLAINLRVTFNSEVTDNEQFGFIVSSATTNTTGSTFAVPNAGGINSVSDDDINRIEVTGYTFEFVQQPPTSVLVNIIMNPAPAVVAIDSNGNIDLDYFSNIFLTSYGTMNINWQLPTLFTNGVYTFGNIIHTSTGTSLALSVGSPDLLGIDSSFFEVSTTAVPSFDAINPICAGAALSLPATSNNGIHGSWSPAIDNTQTTTYTFTPDPGIDATTASLTVVVNPIISPLFTPVAPINVGDTLNALPTTSNNGLPGSWTPTPDNTQTTTYTFTPDANYCATSASLTINVYNSTVIIPTFAAIAPICIDSPLSALPTTSNNGIIGLWSPDLDTTATTTYTFTPIAGQSSTNTVLTIVVNPATVPTFNPIAAIGYGDAIVSNILPTTSLNGITGTWYPPVTNLVTTNYVFTPISGQCASSASLTIVVNPPPSQTIYPSNQVVIPDLNGQNQTVNMPVKLTDTKGELTISNSGLPVYKIPIALPPGIKDVAPQLALEYSGSNVQGVAGMGWNLNGISSIMRVSSRKDLDGETDPVDFDNLDRFALDGQRLIRNLSLPGVQYQTETYSNLKIVAIGNFNYPGVASLSGPETFAVTFPDGSQAFYGHTIDSRGILEWKISLWLDPQGNYISYTYFNENFVNRIIKITWGKNFNVLSNFENTIEFNYKSRLRAEYSYVNGIEIATKKVLSDIKVSTAGQLFRTYTIGHENIAGNYQRVKYIMESNGDNAQTNPIYFDYNNTPGGIGEFVLSNSETGTQINNVDASGDFDGDGSIDFVAKARVYFKPIDIGNNWTGISLGVAADKRIPVTILDNGKLNQFQSVLGINENPDGITYRVRSYNKATNQMDLKISKIFTNFNFSYCRTINNTIAGPFTPCPEGEDLDVPLGEDISSVYLDGDYDGDGITELIHIRPIVKKTTHHINLPYFGPQTHETVVVDGYKSFFLNLKNETLTENNNLLLLAGKANFGADFNGDGRTDILSINKQTNSYFVFQYNVAGSNLEVLFSGTFNVNILSGENVKQVVIGDFNGDSKMDIMIPAADGNTTWYLYTSTGNSFKTDTYTNFELYEPDWQGAMSVSRRRVRTYRAADLNKDGKSDFVTSEWESWNVGGLGNRNSRGHLRYKENIGSLTTRPAFAANQLAQVYSTEGDPITCLMGDFKNPLANFEFAFIQNGKLWKGQYNKDIEAESTLTKVIEINGHLVTDITYKPLAPTLGLGTADDTYHSSNSELYPYTEMIRVPTMKVVDKVGIFDADLNTYKTQLYKYYGLIIHFDGLGVIGFKKIAKSSWFNNTSTDKIWSCFQTDPHIYGQKIYEWSYSGDIHTSFDNPPLTTPGTTDLAISKHTYTTNLTSTPKIIVLNKTVKNDFLTGLTDQTEYFYDSHWNQNRSLHTNAVGTNEIVNTLYDNVNGVGREYAVGRITQVDNIVSAYGDTFTSQEKFIYDSNQVNLVKQFQKKGHNTDYITEDYDYDVYGNVIKKTTSAPNVSPRITKDKYDADGRFVIEKTDIEGFVSKFEYNKLGQITKATDPFNKISNTNYNGWGLITSIITSGVSSADHKTNITYLRSSTGNLVTTSTNVETNEVSRTFVNKLGQTFKTSTKGFAPNSWISKYTKFDYLGRKVFESEPYNDANPTADFVGGTKWNYITYDYLSRPEEVGNYRGRISTTQYLGLQTRTTEGPKVIETTVDANGNKISVKDNGEALDFTYYANGLKKEAIYGNHTVTYGYDGWGRNRTMLDPSVSQNPYTYTYNNYGELIQTVTPTNGIIDVIYSPSGRIMQKNSTGQNTAIQVTYSYDPKGLLIGENGTSNGKSFSYTNTYNSFSQLISEREITPDNFTHLKQFTYDGQGSVLKEQTNSFLTNSPGTNNGNITIEYGYNSYNGMLEQYKDVATNTVLWKLNSTNEQMQTISATFGNGMQVANVYDSNYYIETINHSDGTNTALNLEYQFVSDRGTLTRRKNSIAGVLNWDENFTYDDFERLETWDDPTGSSSNAYESDGRIKENNLVGTYNYGSSSSRYTRTTADLNANGDALYLTRCPQTISYNMFKNPILITELSRGSVAFEYNTDGNRSKSIVYAEDTTLKKNKFYSNISHVEVIEKPNQTLQFITYLAGSPYNAVVALEKSYTASGSSYTANPQEFLYLHRDYQGTILAISGNSGTIKERRQFDPWGVLKKKFIGNTAVPDADLALADFELLTDRGYTGHEHFFSVGIIHMNGRIYDPVLRTFLSPDPVIQAPENSQNYNRYGYCFNNPLLYTDPSGNFVHIPIGVAILIGTAIAGVAYMGMAFYSGTFSWGGLAKSLVVGAISGAASWGVGKLIQSLSTSWCATTVTLTQTQINVALMLPQAIMHGMSQGLIQGIAGGSAEQTFYTAAISSIAAGGYGYLGTEAQSSVGQILFGTFTGGMTAQLTGGNFWEGAVTGLIVSTLNHAAHRIAEGVEFRSRFHINPRGLPTFTIEGVNYLMQNVDGLPEFYNSPDVMSPKIFLSEGKGYSGMYYPDTDLDYPHQVELTREAFSSNYHLARTLFHELFHSFQYHWQNGAAVKYITHRYGDIKRYANGTESDGLRALERHAYEFVLKLGDRNFDTYSKDNINIRKPRK